MFHKLLIATFFIATAGAQAQDSYAVKPDVQDCINVRDDSNSSANISGTGI